MKLVTPQFTPGEVNDLIVLIDMALKTPEGGVKVMPAAMAILDKIKAATEEANKPDNTNGKATKLAETRPRTGRKNARVATGRATA